MYRYNYTIRFYNRKDSIEEKVEVFKNILKEYFKRDKNESFTISPNKEDIVYFLEPDFYEVDIQSNKDFISVLSYIKEIYYIAFKGNYPFYTIRKYWLDDKDKIHAVEFVDKEYYVYNNDEDKIYHSKEKPEIDNYTELEYQVI